MGRWAQNQASAMAIPVLWPEPCRKWVRWTEEYKHRHGAVNLKDLEWFWMKEWSLISCQVFSSLSLRRHAHGPLAKRLMHMAHLSGNTSGVSKSSSDWLNYIGFPGDLSRSLTLRLETKMPWCQTPSRKKKAVVFTNVTTNAYQGQLNAGFSKVCEIFKVRGIESLKYVQEFHTVIVSVCYCGDISTPRNVMLNETNCDWLFDMSVKRPHGRALANKCCHLFQTFSRQSEGLATRD